MSRLVGLLAGLVIYPCWLAGWAAGAAVNAVLTVRDAVVIGWEDARKRGTDGPA